MLLKTNRKKQIFSKRKDIRKFSLDLDPEYVEKLQTIEWDAHTCNFSKNTY